MNINDDDLLDILRRLDGISSQISQERVCSNLKTDLGLKEKIQNLIHPSFERFGRISKNDKEQIITWFEATKSLNEIERIRIRRLALFKYNKVGKLILREPILGSQRAVFILVLLALSACTWVHWILFIAEANIFMILDSIAMGLVLGFFAKVTLDFSFRHQKMFQKLQLIAPRLN